MVLLLSLCPDARAQNGINAPYSQFGVGMGNQPYNMPFAAMTGGAVYARSGYNFVNPFNPASYAAIQPASFVFDIGFNVDMNRISTPSASLYDADANIGYLAFAFPILKWWKTSVGLLPYSDINYESVLFNEPDAVKTRYEGTGAVNQFYWGNAFNIVSSSNGTSLQAGFNINYLMGSVVRGITYDFQGDDSTYFLDSRREKTTRIRNFTFDLGLLYNQPLSSKYTLEVGLVCRTPQAMSVTDAAAVYTFMTRNGVEYLIDTVFPRTGSNEYKSTLEQPLAVGVGLALLGHNRWRVSTDMEWSAWKGLKYTENASFNIFGQSTLSYDSYSRYSLGMQWLGNKDATKYMHRIAFSGGLHCDRGLMYLSTSNEPINEVGFGLGASLPMRKGRSLLNIGVAYSRFGNADLLTNSCTTISLSIASCESWFVKRKYD